MRLPIGVIPAYFERHPRRQHQLEAVSNLLFRFTFVSPGLFIVVLAFWIDGLPAVFYVFGIIGVPLAILLLRLVAVSIRNEIQAKNHEAANAPSDL